MTSEPQTAGDGGTGESDGRGQSEVIGTILLVAIAIVVAVAAGEFVFGLDVVTFDQPTVGPQASFEAIEDDESLTIEHRSGDALDMDEITVEGVDDPEADLGDQWTAGEAVTVDDPDEGHTVRILWRSPETDDSTVLFEHEYEG